MKARERGWDKSFAGWDTISGSPLEGAYMRFVAVLLALFPFIAPVAVAAPRIGGTSYHIVLPRHGVAAGEHVDLKLVPPPPPGAGVGWSVVLVANAEAAGLPGGIYWAPYSIPAGAPPATVQVEIRDGRTTSFAKAEIELIPGSVPGVEDCLGPNQTFSIATADLTHPYPAFTSGGYVVQRVEPVYPRSAFVRGVNDTINVQALVCRTGRVLDAHVLPTYRDITNPFEPDPSSLVEHDPKLVEAAVAAVRQYVYAPAIADGHPVAFVSVTAVLFNR